MLAPRQSSDTAPLAFKSSPEEAHHSQDRTHDSLTGVGCWRKRGRTDAPEAWTAQLSLAAYLAFAPSQSAARLCSGLTSRQSDASGHSQSYVLDSQQSIDGGLAA